MSTALARAYDMAARAHAGQTRKGRMGIPYVNHPIEVAAMVAEAGADEPVVIAAVLHDVVEDSDVALGEIEAAFGAQVAAMVDALTDDPSWSDLPRPERKRRQAERVPGAPKAVRLIKIADQTSNLSDVAREPDAWGPAEARSYAESMRPVMDACRGTSAELEARFDAALAELEHVLAKGAA